MAALSRSRRDSYDIARFRAKRQAAVNWPLVAILAVAGLMIGWSLRPVVFLVAVPEADRRPGAPSAPVCMPAAHGPPSAAQPPPAGSPAAGRLRRLAAFAGRCPECRSRTGPPLLTIEVTTAVLLGALAARVHPALVLAAACWLAVCAVALAWTDAAVQRLPDVLTVAAYTGTTVLLLLAAAAGGHWGDLLRAVAGGAILAAGYLVLVAVSRSAMGLGDAKLAASLGTMLAWAGWPALISGTLAAFLLATVYGLGLLAARRGTLRQRIPFGPFMIAGAFLALLAATAL